MCDHETIKSYNTPDGVLIKCADCGHELNTVGHQNHEKALQEFTSRTKSATLEHNVHDIGMLTEENFLLEDN